MGPGAKLKQGASSKSINKSRQWRRAVSLAQDPMTAQVTRLENQAWDRDCPRLMAGSQIALQAIRGGINTETPATWVPELLQCIEPLMSMTDKYLIVLRPLRLHGLSSTCIFSNWRS